MEREPLLEAMYWEHHTLPPQEDHPSILFLSQAGPPSPRPGGAPFISRDGTCSSFDDEPSAPLLRGLLWISVICGLTSAAIFGLWLLSRFV